YVEDGARFLLVGADAAILARGSEALAQRYIDPSAHSARASY
ncbi:MAG: 2-dehydro-3-deoxyglucarate aldolase, partial [Rhizobiaceae bacterium]